MQLDALLLQEKARQETYRLLSKFYYLPDKKLKSELVHFENLVAKICSEAATYVSQMKAKFEKTTDLNSLEVDYSKLFVGPYRIRAPPYGSVYLEEGRRVMGNSTIDARNKYLEAGLALSKDFKEPPDHIAAELEFISFLISKEIKALANFEFDVAMGYLQKQQSFMKTHLGVWVFEFADKIEEYAETAFYRYLGRVTKTFIKKDLSNQKTSIYTLSEIQARVRAVKTPEISD